MSNDQLKQKIKKLEEENKKLKDSEQENKTALAQSRELSTNLIFANKKLEKDLVESVEKNKVKLAHNRLLLDRIKNLEKEKEKNDQESNKPTTEKMGVLWKDIFKNRSNKKFSNLGYDQRSKFIKQLETNLDCLQRRLAETRNVGIKNIVLVDADRDHITNFKISFQQSSIDNIEEFYLYLKDKNRISDKLFNLFRKQFKFNVPTLAKIKKLRKKLNDDLSFFEVNEEQVNGLYLDPKVAIENKIRYLIKKDLKFQNNVIKIKLSADGLNVSRNFKLINIIFTVINEEKKAAGVNGAYPIGLFEIKVENYDSIANWMSNIWNKCQEFTELIIEGDKFSLVYYFGSDYKMNSIALGLYSANSKYPCIYCKSEDSKLFEPPDESLNRSLTEHLAIIRGPKTGIHYGYKNIPLIINLQYNFVVIDLLHLVLRVTDKLFMLLFEDLAACDSFEKGKIEDKHTNLCKFMDFLVNSNAKVNIDYDFNKKNELYSCLSFLSASSRVIIIKQIDIHKLFGDKLGVEKIKVDDYLEFAEDNEKDETGQFINPENKTITDIDRSKIINKVWKDWLKILISLKDKKIPTPEELKKTNEKWLKNFLRVFHKDQVTPYIHIFAHHLHKLYELHGNVDFFNVNGLEKLNDFTKLDYHRSTNKKQALKQIFLKRCRIDKLLENFENNTKKK